jgi:hypothetical protein
MVLGLVQVLVHVALARGLHLVDGFGMLLAVLHLEVVLG